MRLPEKDKNQGHIRRETPAFRGNGRRGAREGALVIDKVKLENSTRRTE